jgi:hypothetical protein
LDQSTDFLRVVQDASQARDLSVYDGAVSTKLPEPLDPLYNRILLIGSRAAAKAAVRVLNIELLILALAVESMATEFDQKKWDSLTLRIADIKWSFMKVARRDLGLRRRSNSVETFDRRRPTNDPINPDISFAPGITEVILK